MEPAIFLIVMLSTAATLLVLEAMIGQLNKSGNQPRIQHLLRQRKGFGEIRKIKQLHAKQFPVSTTRRLFTVLEYVQLALGASMVAAFVAYLATTKH